MNFEPRAPQSDREHSAAESVSDLEVPSTGTAVQQWMHELVQNIDAIFWEWEPQTFQFKFVSKAAASLGYPIEQWLSVPDFWITLIHPDDREQVINYCRETIAQGKNHDFEYRVIAADGRVVWLHHLVCVVRRRGEVRQVGGLMLDITKRKQVELALQQQAERERLMRVITQQMRQSLSLEKILNTTVVEVRQCLQADRTVVFRYEVNGSSIVVAESVTSDWNSIIGFTVYESWFPAETTHYRIVAPLILHDMQQLALPAEVREIVQQQQVKAVLAAPIFQDDQLLGVLAVHQCSGVRQWQPFEVDLLEQLAAQLAIAIQQSNLYQQLEQANRELQSLAAKDGLTQVANRRYFDEYLDQEWRRLSREQLPLSLILCDIDFFKLYNDTYGHQVGDECLQQVARTMTQVVQRPADLVARYGGEEFAVILPNTATTGALHLAEQIRMLVKTLALAHASSQTITLSIGVASIVPHLESSPSALIAAADRALYQAKWQGRDRVILGSISPTRSQG